MIFSSLFPLAVASASVLVSISLLSPAAAMMANPMPFYERQPDGQVIELKIHGDDHDNWMSDIDGYTVVRDPVTAAFVYAELDDDGEIQPSQEEVMEIPHQIVEGGSDFPLAQTIRAKKRKKQTSKKQKGLRPAKKDCTVMLCDGAFLDEGDGRRNLRGRGNPVTTNSTRQFSKHSRNLLATTGTLRNLVVLMQWSDHSKRVLPTQEEIGILMNHRGRHPLCPTGSVRDVFLENSYGALNLESVVTPWIPMDNTETYYANRNRGLTTLTWAAIRYALQYLDNNKLVDFSSFDTDQDGKIDSITVLHSGYGAEWAGTDSSGRFYMDRIWSHKWGIYSSPFVSRDGVRVREYHISPALWSTAGSAIGRIGVIAHETGHFLGMPDLYDTDGGGQGMGTYELMANSWGWDGSQYYPPHMSAWVKQALGWIDVYQPTLGVNTIEAAEVQDATFPQVYRITEGFPDGEFLLIENRQRLGFDSIMPQGGLAIWHVDLTTDFGGIKFKASLNQEGHPWQENWPQNGNHYGIALVQADGLFELERGVNGGDRDDIFHAGGVSEITPCLDIGNCQFPNTDSYQGGVASQTNVLISDISISGRIMTFKYSIAGSDLVTSTPSASPSDNPTPSPTDSPTEAPILKFTPAPTFKATSPPTRSPTNQIVASTMCLATNKGCTEDSQCCSGSCRIKRRQCR